MRRLGDQLFEALEQCELMRGLRVLRQFPKASQTLIISIGIATASPANRLSARHLTCEIGSYALNSALPLCRSHEDRQLVTLCPCRP